MNYWHVPVDPLNASTEFSTDIINPTFIMKKTGAIPSVKKHSNTDTGISTDLLLWIAFILALIAVIALALVYRIMKQRKKKLML